MEKLKRVQQTDLMIGAYSTDTMKTDLKLVFFSLMKRWLKGDQVAVHNL